MTAKSLSAEQGTDWHREPRKETTLDILSRTLVLCPLLAPPAVRLLGRAPVSEDLALVEAEIVDFRPSRKAASIPDSGLLLETGESISTPEGDVDVVYSYGQGSFGWQCCWGCTETVVDLLGGPKRPGVGSRIRTAAGVV